MPGFEFKRIGEGPDEGKYRFFIEGIVAEGVYTMAEIEAKIGAMEDMPEPGDKPWEIPCVPTCTKRRVGCHGICPAYFVYRHWRADFNAKKAMAYEPMQFTLDTTKKIKKRQHRQKG